MTHVREITNADEFNNFVKSRRGAIFYGVKGCDACDTLWPMFQRLAKRYHTKIAMAHADVEECGLSFEKVPLIVTYRKGDIVNQMIGANIQGLKEIITEALTIQ